MEKYEKEEEKDDKDIVKDQEMTDITEDNIEKLEEKLETAYSDQKNLFLIVFQHFIMLLSEHIQSCESQNKSFKNHWFRWCIGRLQQIFFEVNYYFQSFFLKKSLSSFLSFFKAS